MYTGLEFTWRITNFLFFPRLRSPFFSLLSKSAEWERTFISGGKNTSRCAVLPNGAVRSFALTFHKCDSRLISVLSTDGGGTHPVSGSGLSGPCAGPVPGSVPCPSLHSGSVLCVFGTFLHFPGWKNLLCRAPCCAPGPCRGLQSDSCRDVCTCD